MMSTALKEIEFQRIETGSESRLTVAGREIRR